MRRLAVLLLLLSGCRPAVRFDQPLTRLPSSLAWCGPSPRTVTPRSDTAGPQDEHRVPIPAKSFSRCTSILLEEAKNLEGPDLWTWTVEFGVTTNEQGRVESVCAWGATFGNPTRYLECLTDELLRSGITFQPNLKKGSYLFTFVYD